MAESSNGPKASEKIIMLNWRERPQARDILTRIHSKILDADHFQKVSVELGETMDSRIIKLGDFNGNRMMTRISKISSRNVESHHAYVAKFVAVGIELATMIKAQEPRKLRKIQYLLETKTLPKVMVERIINDWAVTLHIHPWALGVDTQSQGNISVPPGLTLTCELVPNVFKGDTRNHGLVGIETPIPARINHIAVKMRQGFKLRAVVVTEHRGIDLTAADFKPHVEDLVIFQCGGYPSRSLRELLNLLSLHPRFKGIPFLYLSDHDPHGQHIFTGLKYGTKAAAWASASQVCSQLQWTGPTVTDLHATVEAYSSIRRAERRASNPHITEEQAAADEVGWKTRMRANLNTRMARKKVTKDDLQLYNGMKNSGVLDTEPELAADMKAMIKHKQKFSLHFFTAVRPQGVELYLLERISLLAPSPNAPPIVTPIVQVSQFTAMANAAESQESSQEVTPRRAAAARNVNISMN